MICFCLLCVCELSAQKNKKFDQEKFKSELEQYITTQACLTPQEAAAFFPVYEEMLNKQRVLFEKRRQFKHNKPTHEAACRKRILEMDDCSIKIEEIKRDYHRRFFKILSASKLYDVIKAERRFYRTTFKRVAKGKK